jgi:hypothetical protein
MSIHSKNHNSKKNADNTIFLSMKLNLNNFSAEKQKLHILRHAVAKSVKNIDFLTIVDDITIHFNNQKTICNNSFLVY